MRRLLPALVLCVFAAVPATAKAGFILEASVGKGAQVSPSTRAEPINVMIAPGVQFLSGVLRLELGIVNTLPDVENSKYNLEFRPMVVVSPPILPIYGRGIMAVTNILDREGQKREIAYGAAVGLMFGLGPIGVFGEVGALPRSRADELSWIIEGRLGAYIGF